MRKTKDLRTMSGRWLRESGAKENIMDSGDVERQASEIANDTQQARGGVVQDMVERLGITPELANYLLDLELRIRRLEGGGRTPHGGLRP
jgi:hypothetical protein